MRTVRHSVSMVPLGVRSGVGGSSGVFHLRKNVQPHCCVFEVVLDIMHRIIYVDTCHLRDIGLLHWGKYVCNP